MSPVGSVVQSTTELWVPTDDSRVKELFPGEWTVILSGFGQGSTIRFKFSDVVNPLQVNIRQGTIRAVVNPNHMPFFVPGTWGTVDLFYQMYGNEQTIFLRKLARVVG